MPVAAWDPTWYSGRFDSVAILHCVALLVTVWISQFESLKGNWVSDDWDGIAKLTGKFQHIGHPTTAPSSSGGLPAPGSIAGGSLWNDIVSWVRWQLCKTPNPSYNKPLDAAKPDGPRDTRQFIPSPLKHHRAQLIVMSGLVLLVYTFLSSIATPDIAFLATLLWTVHPVCCQTVTWISGQGYLTAAFFMFAGLNYALSYASALPSLSRTEQVALLGGYGVLQWLAFRSQFTAIAAVVILTYLKLWPFAAVAGVIACIGAYRTIKEVVSVRAATFKQQQMGASTQFHWRKLVVVGKTLYYYTKLAFFPKRLGLYHTYGYHYPLPWIEWEDKYFWAGLAIGLAMLAGIIWAPSALVAFGCLWWLAFIVFVLNLITVHQFVAERYVWLPVLGLCLIVAAYAPAWLFWAAFGVLIMRTWAHLPTYANELKFYQSNIWNHETSEVAFGNLGVTYLRLGHTGTAVDTWNVGANVNNDYDVNWYNLYSVFRGQGLHHEARQYLLKALSCSTCHFPKEWRKELETLEMEIAWQKAMATVPPEQRLAWQNRHLTESLKHPEMPHRDYWEAKHKRVKEEMAKATAVPAAGPAQLVSVAPMPPRELLGVRR